MADLREFEERCGKTVEHFKNDLTKVRSGRASAALLEDVRVDYYGAKTPLKQMAMINAPEPRLITVQVYDESATESVDKAIRSSDLGFNPNREGNLLRINVPALTEERRKDIVRSLHKMAEEAKIALRNLRREEIDKLKKQQKNKDISEDDLHRGQDEVQKVTDTFTAQIDELMAAKEKEVLEV